MVNMLIISLFLILVGKTMTMDRERRVIIKTKYYYFCTINFEINHNTNSIVCSDLKCLSNDAF